MKVTILSLLLILSGNAQAKSPLYTCEAALRDLQGATLTVEGFELTPYINAAARTCKFDLNRCKVTIPGPDAFVAQANCVLEKVGKPFSAR